MIKINCYGCTKPNHCCQNIHLTPILLPSEEAVFRVYSEKVKTPYRDMFALRKNPKDNCVFLNEDTKQCSIYNQERPLECFLYPFLLNFSDSTPKVTLDDRFCPHIKTLEYNLSEIIIYVRNHQFPIDWIKGYDSLQDY